MSSKKPVVAVCANLRNASDYLGYYRAAMCNQIGDGQEFELVFSLLEGDSSDDTLPKLQAWAAEDPRVVLTKKDIGEVADFDERVRLWADLCNTVVDALAGRDYDYLLWCESDLCFPSDLVQMLLDSRQDVVAPAIFLGGMFYDSWGFRGTDGKQFGAIGNIHPSYSPFALFPVNSVGSVVLFSRKVLDAGIRFRGVYENGLLVGMCNEAREKGFGVYCDSRVSVIHPTSLWQRGKYRLGAVQVQGLDGQPEFASQLHEKITQSLAKSGAPALGQPNLPPGHQFFQGLQTQLQLQFPGHVFAIGTKLHTETPRCYAVVCTVQTPVAQPAADGQTIVVDAVFFQMYQTGIARVWRSLLREWAQQDFGRRLVVLDRGRTAPRFEGLRYVDVPRHDYAKLDADRAALQRVCDAENAAVFISSYCSAPLTTPTVFMVHDMIPELLGGDALNTPMWREKHAAVRQAERFVAVSDNTARDLRRFFPEVAAKQVSVAHCGVDFRAPSPEAIAAFRQAHGITKPYFLQVGARGGYKNNQLFFNAFASLGDERAGYAIVCTGPQPKLESAFADQAGPATVHLLNLSDEALQAAYAGAQALVYPSLYEGFGMPIIEAMACGCPVITCATGSIPEVAGDAALYVGTGDVPAMARALRQVQDATERARLVAVGLQRASAYSWHKMASEVGAALQAVAAGHVQQQSQREQLLGTALQHHQLGELAPAEAIYHQLLARSATDFVALHLLGVAQFQRGDLATAEQLLLRALAVNDVTPQAHYNLGNVRLAQGRLEEARACYQRCLALDGSFAPAQQQLQATEKAIAQRATPA